MRTAIRQNRKKEEGGIFRRQPIGSSRNTWPRVSEAQHLQGAIGNQALSRLLTTSPVIQRKVGDGHDLTSERFRDDMTLQACYDNERLLHLGHRGEAVKRVQETLVSVGFAMPLSTKSDGELDGIFGSETKGTVKKYQISTGCAVDGIVGPETIGDMDGLPPCRERGEEKSLFDVSGQTLQSDSGGLCLSKGNGKKPGVKYMKCGKEAEAVLSHQSGEGCAATATIYSYSKATVKKCDNSARFLEAYSVAQKECEKFCKKKGPKCEGYFLPEDWNRAFQCVDCSDPKRCTPANPPECPYTNQYWGLWINPKYSKSEDAPRNCFCEVPIDPNFPNS